MPAGDSAWSTRMPAQPLHTHHCPETHAMLLQDPFAMLSACREVNAGPGASMACDGSGGGSSEAPLPGKRPALDDGESEDAADEDIARLVRERMLQHRQKRARRRRVRA